MKNKITAVTLLVLVATSAFAQRNERYDRHRDYPQNRSNQQYGDNRLPANDRREAAQINDLQREARARIGQGIANGALTSREAIRLLNDYDRIAAKEHRYTANRDLTKRESRDLTNDLQKLMRGIQYENTDFERENNRLAQEQPRRY